MGGDSDQHFLKRGDFIKKVEDPWSMQYIPEYDIKKKLTMHQTHTYKDSNHY